MIAIRKIHEQAYIAVFMLFAIVVVMAVASFQGAFKFRELSKSIQERSMELPKAAELGKQVNKLRSLLYKLDHEEMPAQYTMTQHADPRKKSPFAMVDRADVAIQLDHIKQALQDYEIQIQASQSQESGDHERRQEIQFVAEFKSHLRQIEAIVDGDETGGNWVLGRHRIYNPLDDELSELQRLAAKIPIYMQHRTEAFAGQSRSKYKAWIWVTGISGLLALLTLLALGLGFRQRFMKPLRTLLHGSREVAGGNFNHRIKLQRDDEFAELGDALNSMTEKFQAIKSDLNRQVKERTKEVVRSEKMASVGFLAAGVAHEINNPLASIAWSAESLESRIQDILDPTYDRDEDQMQAEIDDMKKYLRRIQSEAFRVKEITGGLLDFSRMGDVQKKPTNLNLVIESVIDIVRPLGKYRSRNILFNSDESIVIVVNEQELKQVTLNLITNALGSVDENGTVEIELRRDGDSAVLVIKDDGCGMDDEVKQHLFEPFFTRRRDGQGTGLGLSITYQIIEEHGGCINAHSDGVGHGSTFTIRLPLVKNEQQLSKSA